MSPKAKPTKPIDIYVRVSDVNGRSGDTFISPGLQEERCRAQLVADGLPIGQVFTDLDVSGGKASRPEFDKAKARIESGVSGGIAVYKLSRFGRRQRQVRDDIEWIEAQEGTFVCVDPKIDTSSPTGRFVLSLFAALDELELDNISENWKVSKAKALKRGAFTCRTPWGYMRADDGTLVIDPDLAPIVRELFLKRAKGWGFYRLAEWLHEKKIRTSRGAEVWAHSAIKYVLENRAYMGQLVYDGVTIDIPAIVTEAEWEAAAAAKRVHKVEPKHHSRDSLLVGLVRCAHCEHTMRYVTHARVAPRFYCRYAACEARPSIYVDPLEAMVEQRFLADVKANVRVATAAKARERAAETQAAVDAAERELLAYVTMTSALDPQVFQVGADERQKVLDAAKAEHAAALSEARQYDNVPSGDLHKSWPTLSVEHKRRLLASYYERVSVEWAKHGTAVEDRVKLDRTHT